MNDEDYRKLDHTVNRAVDLFVVSGAIAFAIVIFIGVMQLFFPNYETLILGLSFEAHVVIRVLTITDLVVFVGSFIYALVGIGICQSHDHDVGTKWRNEKE